MKLKPPIPTLDLTALPQRPEALSTEAYTCRLLVIMLAFFVAFIALQLLIAILTPPHVWTRSSTPSQNPLKTSSSNSLKPSPLP